MRGSADAGHAERWPTACRGHRHGLRRPGGRGAAGGARLSGDGAGEARCARAAAPMSTGRTASPSMPARPSSPRPSCSRSCGSVAGKRLADDVDAAAGRPFYRIRFDDGAIVRLLPAIPRRCGPRSRGSRPAMSRATSASCGERGDLPDRLRAAGRRAVRQPGPTWLRIAARPDPARRLPHGPRPGRPNMFRDPRAAGRASASIRC